MTLVRNRMRHRRSNFFWISLLLLLFTFFQSSSSLSSSSPLGWSVKEFPAPTESTTSFVVDPDGILSETKLTQLNDFIQTVTTDVATTTAATVSVPEEQSSIAVQLAVAIVEKMNLSAYNEHQEEIAAEDFGRQLHDTWGVGHTTSDGQGTGVLIFLSVQDRVIYISRGGALDKVLNDARIEHIISSTARPYLKQAKYAEGLMETVNAVVEYIHKGEPDWKEHVLQFFQGPYLFLMMWFGLLFNGIFGAYRQRQRDRAYAQAQSQLSELDRARALALQGQYQATSCPICLETFISSTIGSDEQPIKLLRCGHVFDETCWSEWINSGQGTITKCPICQKDVGESADLPSPDATPVNADAGAFRVDQMVMNPNDEDHHHHRQQHQFNRQQERAVQRFQQERNFRLMRLAVRYPNFINNHQIQRWTSPTYDGDLARDPAFVKNNPRTASGSMGSSGSGSHGGRPMSFGGGTSSGGRGGRF